ncbi:MAG: hypothetical protein R2860_05265 [Desulfobacterales bacterium]
MGVNDLDATVATGYGRNSVDFADKAITEITCHGAGRIFRSGCPFYYRHRRPGQQGD